MTDLAVIIVTWNNAREIEAALRSLLADLDESGLRHAVWLVDSASTDATVALVRQRFPRVQLIVSEANIGFGACNNLALRRLGFDGGAATNALPKAVYLLNPDTITHGGATRRLYDALMSRADAGLVGARLSFADGRFQHGAFRFPGLRQLYCEFFPTPGRLLEGGFNGRYSRALYDGGQPFPVDFTLGATMMLRREVILETGMFDERFFLYCEEIDWAWRIQKAGWRAFCEPRARVTHLGGGSTSQASASSFVHLWKSRLLLYETHQPRWKRRVARRLIALGLRRRLRQLGESQSDMRRACHDVIEMAEACPT